MCIRDSLSANYIGLVERGEKIPSLESFISIVNALGVSADMVLHDVLETGYEVKSSLSVSYTHLDVYKRQLLMVFLFIDED